MSDLLSTFVSFMEAKEEETMFVTGIAGTGKTTTLAELLQYCIDNRISAVATAYTHRACTVLRSKLPAETKICTLHSFLTKRPTINDKATTIHKLESNSQTSRPEKIDVLFIDEFSMVGEKDFVSINELLYDDDGNTVMKVVYIGDPNQLPPVKDAKAVVPGGRFWVKLDKVYRQANSNPLLDTLILLNDYINGEEPQALLEHETFVRGVDIVEKYKNNSTNKVLLAYTNARVEELNALIEGRTTPRVGDMVFSPTTRKKYLVLAINDEATEINTPRDVVVELNSKYKTLETFHTIEGVKFYTLEDDEGEEYVYGAIFGHNSFLHAQQNLANGAVNINKKIFTTTQQDPKDWAKANWQLPLAKERASNWSRYLTFKDCAICLDFEHAMTVHKSQGSTFETVFLDMEDLSLCSRKDYSLYLKLLYVAISRASDIVYTN
ncbi:MAG: DUF2075 domain-containing protein [Negativicutes bacterium]|nr:DUF2075 domain-containing protein [Negativicutes bacterium]